MVTELFLVQTFVLRHPVLNLTLFLLQDLLPRYRKMASNESVVFMVSGISDDEDRMTEAGGGDELVNRSYRDRAADDLGHRDVTRNLSREL